MLVMIIFFHSVVVLFACKIVYRAASVSVSGDIAFLGVRSTLCIFLSSVSMLFCFSVDK